MWRIRQASGLLTLLTLKSTFRILARMMLPIAINPISLDQAAMSSSTLRTSASRERSEVMRSVPGEETAEVVPSAAAKSGIGRGGCPRE